MKGNLVYVVGVVCVVLFFGNKDVIKRSKNIWFWILIKVFYDKVCFVFKRIDEYGYKKKLWLKDKKVKNYFIFKYCLEFSFVYEVFDFYY